METSTGHTSYMATQSAPYSGPVVDGLAQLRQKLAGPRPPKNVLVFDLATEPQSPEVAAAVIAWLLAAKSGRELGVVLMRGQPAAMQVQCPCCPAALRLNPSQRTARGHAVAYVGVGGVPLDAPPGSAAAASLAMCALVASTVFADAGSPGIGLFSPAPELVPGGTAVTTALSSLGARVTVGAVPPATAARRSSQSAAYLRSRQAESKTRATRASPRKQIPLPSRLTADVVAAVLSASLDSFAPDAVDWLRDGNGGWRELTQVLSELVTVGEATDAAPPPTNAFKVAMNRAKIWLSNMMVHQRASLPKSYEALCNALEPMMRVQIPSLFPPEYLALQMVHAGVIDFCEQCGSLANSPGSSMLPLVRSSALTALGSGNPSTDNPAMLPPSAPFARLILALFARVEAWMARQASKRVSLPVVLRGIAASSALTVAVPPRVIIDKLQVQGIVAGKGGASTGSWYFTLAEDTHAECQTIHVVYAPALSVPPAPTPLDVSLLGRS